MWVDMKRWTILLALLIPVAAAAQRTTEVSGRASVGAEYKIVKGLHLNVSEEIRTGSGFSSLGSLRTTAGLSYKPAKFIKLGAGYTLINPYKTSAAAFNNPRHRFWADVSGYLVLGDFQFSLRERLQLTHRTGDFNVYQSTPDALGLKSRIGVKYKRFKAVEPSVSFEVRTALNDPWGEVTSSTIQTTKGGKTYYPYQFSGYTHVYNNRYRLNIGADVRLSKHHHLEPYLLLDSCSDYEIDTNSDGTRLYTATTAWNETMGFVLGLSYTLSF